MSRGQVWVRPVEIGRSFPAANASKSRWRWWSARRSRRSLRWRETPPANPCSSAETDDLSRAVQLPESLCCRRFQGLFERAASFLSEALAGLSLHSRPGQHTWFPEGRGRDRSRGNNE